MLSALAIFAIALPGTTMAVTVQQIDSFLGAGDICMAHQLDRYIWVHAKDSEWQGRTFSERYKTALHVYKEKNRDYNPVKLVMNGPWDKALVPVLEAQRDSIVSALLLADSSESLIRGIGTDGSGNLLELNSLESYLKKNLVRGFPNLIQQIAKQFGGNLRKPEELLNPAPDETYVERLKKLSGIAVACAQLSVAQGPACVTAVKATLTEANYSANLILPKIWYEFIRTPKLRDGARLGALIMLQRMQNQRPGRFFEDLVEGFRRAKLSEADAVEATWKLLALYGNGGANTGLRLLALQLPAEAEVLAVSLSFVGTAVTYLEFAQRMAGNRSYAFPAEVDGNCLTAKPYHFWLNAYLSRWLVKQNFTPEVAQSAVFIVNKGYQVNRDVNNAGGAVEKLLSKPTNHPTNEVIRIDLNVGAAGSVYGSLAGNKPLKPLPLQEGVRRSGQPQNTNEAVFDKSTLNKLVPDRMRLIALWEKVYQPNQMLLHFQTSQK